MFRTLIAFYQLGQWAASRADLFPASLCEQMGKLHSNGDPHPIQHTRKVIEKVFGRKFEDIFDSFEETPIGCGAIAQVGIPVDAAGARAERLRYRYIAPI